jgi:tetratricopeptide (TPR) repeat protein
MCLDFFRTYPRLDKNGRAYLRGRVMDWTLAIALLVFWMAIFPSALWQALDPFARDPLILLVAHILAFFGLLGTFNGNALLPARWTFGGPLIRGDYDGAIHRIDRLLRFRPQNILFKSWRGYVLLLAGRYDEAERLWRDLLLNSQTNGGTLGIAASNLGYALMGQERFDEALPYLEVGVRMTPELGSIYSGVATYYLRQNIEPERSLEFMSHAVALTPRPKKLKGLEAYLWSTLLSSQAVAAVRSGEQSLTDNSLNLAFADSDPRFLPGVAGLHYDAGRVAQARGDTAGAESHFTRAIELDPHGHVGKQASRARREIEERGEMLQ